MIKVNGLNLFYFVGIISIISASSELDLDLDTQDLEELGSMNDINVFKDGLKMFGIESESGESRAQKDLQQPKENYPDTFIDYNSKSALDIIEGRPLPSQLWLFVSKENGDFETVLPLLENLPKEFQGQLLFVICNVDKPSLSGTIESVRVNKKQVPTARIIYISTDSMDIYKPRDDFVLTTDEVQSFCEQYLLNKLKPAPAGQMIPDDWNKKPVKYLVADNYDNFLTENRDKRVVVKYYSPTCSACTVFAKTFEAAAKELEGSDDVILAEIDITQNAINDHVMVLPTMKIIENGKIIHTSNGLDYKELMEVLTKPNSDKN